MKIVIFMRVYGDKFCPAIAEKKAGVVFNYKCDINCIQDEEFENMYPYGAIKKDVGLGEDYIKVLNEFIDFIQDKVPVFREYGAENFVLSIGVYYRFQCNLEVDNDLIKRVADLGFHVALSCYYDPDLPDEWDPEFIPLE